MKYNVNKYLSFLHIVHNSTKFKSEYIKSKSIKGQKNGTGGILSMPKRGENIRKRKDGRFEARLIDFYKINGKAHYKSFYAKTYGEVKQKMRLFNKDNTIIKTKIKKQIEEISHEWLEKARLRLKQSSYCRYYSIVNNHILPYFKNHNITAITRETAEKFIDCKLQKLSIKTVHDMTSVLIQILKFAERNCYISNFNYDIDLPKLHRKELEVLNITEEQKLNNYLKNNLTLENFGVILSKTTGIRIGELCALKWNDFNLDNGTVYINKTIQRIKNLNTTAKGKTKIIITTPKSQKSIREIPLSDVLISTIKKLYNKENSDTYILTNKIKYIEPRIYQKKFKKILTQINIRNINFHSLRHLFATKAVENGFDIKSLSEILGHSTVRFTLDRYVHSSFELKRENMNKIASCF